MANMKKMSNRYMGRITFEGNFCDISRCYDDGRCRITCSPKQVWERLKAYENTGLTPEQLQNMRWIPVTERLPIEAAEVPIVYINHSPASYYNNIKNVPQRGYAIYFRGKWYWWSQFTLDILGEYGKCEDSLLDKDLEVTHWMPLPEAPEVEL